VACTSIFLEHLKISTIDFYIYRRAINWFDHVARAHVHVDRSIP